MPPAILASLFSRARFLFLLRYALAFYDVKYLTDYNLLQLENIIPLGLVDIRNKYYVKSADYELWTSKIEIQEGDLLITNAGRVGAFLVCLKVSGQGLEEILQRFQKKRAMFPRLSQVCVRKRIPQFVNLLYIKDMK